MPVIDHAAVQPTPLTERIRLIDVESCADERIEARAVVVVDPDNPIFGGHYPGLPIFPGVGLIEGVHRTVLGVASADEIVPVLDAVLTARFVRPVFPRDEIDARVLITREPLCWTVAAELRGPQGRVGKVNLRYRLPGDAS